MFAVAVDADGGAALGIKPYMAKKLREESSKFTKQKLKAIVDKLAEVDYMYKTGVISQYDLPPETNSHHFEYEKRY